MTRILIALLAARVVTSFTGGAASIRPHRSELAAATMTKPEKKRLTEALPGIHLPGSSSILGAAEETYLPTNVKVGKYLLSTACKKATGPKMLNNGKDSLESWREVVASTAKKAYTAKLKKLPDFSTLGYIYSDWAKDGFDGKQLTVTTYI